MILSSFFSFASLNIVFSGQWAVGSVRQSQLPTAHYPLLTIYVSQNNINTADDGNDVRDQRAFDHLGQRREVDEGRGAHVDSVWTLRAVADYVEPEFSARRFDGLIDLADRNGEAFRREQEVMDHHVDVLFHQIAVWQLRHRIV